jgi:molecular chaperone GrpE
MSKQDETITKGEAEAKMSKLASEAYVQEAVAGEGQAAWGGPEANAASEAAAADGTAAAEATASVGGTFVASAEARIAELEAQVAELKDQYLRKAADFDNFRKRMSREKQEAIDFANQALLLDLVQIMDDFERAIKSAETADLQSGKDFQTFCEGVSMIEKRLSSLLENKWGLKRFDSAGEIFDPNKHEALMMEKSADATEATVAEDLVKGYTLKDRVIRPAKVKVLMPE